MPLVGAWSQREAKNPPSFVRFEKCKLLARMQRGLHVLDRAGSSEDHAAAAAELLSHWEFYRGWRADAKDEAAAIVPVLFTKNRNRSEIRKETRKRKKEKERKKEREENREM